MVLCQRKATEQAPVRKLAEPSREADAGDESNYGG
jgi:hypothetical protein